MNLPSTNPALRLRIKQRLLQLSPRAFELFAGDLLVYVGLQNIVVTRYISDGGIDAQGELVSTSGLMRVRTGIQVKRHQHNVQRADIDRFIGALSGQYHHGIFITTADYASTAKIKASSSPLIGINTIDGTQIVDLMVQHGLGLLPDSTSSRQLDEDYFLDFEALRPSQIRESPAAYGGTSSTTATPIHPHDDLISLRALSYMLRVDSTTIRGWVERGTLIPDHAANNAHGLFFRRNRIDSIREHFGISAMPTSSSAWRQEFVDFVRSRNLTKSYKPVFLKALLKVVDRNGRAAMDAVVEEFQRFYKNATEHPIALCVGLHVCEVWHKGY